MYSKVQITLIGFILRLFFISWYSTYIFHNMNNEFLYSKLIIFYLSTQLHKNINMIASYALCKFVFARTQQAMHKNDLWAHIFIFINLFSSNIWLMMAFWLNKNNNLYPPFLISYGRGDFVATYPYTKAWKEILFVFGWGI